MPSVEYDGPVCPALNARSVTLLMPFLYGRNYSPLELRQFSGDLAQLAGVRLVEYQDGKARGLHVAQVWTGSGLCFDVLLDRGMDIGAAAHSGRAMAWQYPTLAAPAFYDSYGAGWVRTWGGGLLTTGGLTFFGQPENDNGESLGLHGRISHAPAERVSITQEWQANEYVLQLTGRVRQAVVFGENLVLTRTITTKLGGNSFTVRDTIANEGFRPAPHMILYHCNFGFPVVSPDSEILLDAESVRPRDANAKAGLGRERHFEPPAPDFLEQVFFHKPRADTAGFAQSMIRNRALNFGAYLKWKADTLPCLTQWKVMQAGEYVCALEPASNWETSRAKLRQEGQLKLLAPGESVEYQLEFGIVV